MGRFDALTRIEQTPEKEEPIQITPSPTKNEKPVNEKTSLLANQQTNN
jgi:hypothetical protein